MRDGLDDTDLTDLADEPAIEEVEGETPEATEGDPEEVVITLAGEEPPEQKEHIPAPQWVKDLRKEKKELARRVRELEAERAAIAAPERPVELPPKPKIEDVQFDVEKYTEAVEAWLDKKRAHDERLRKAQESQQAAQAEWQDRLAKYGQAKASLRVPDYDEAEDAVMEAFSVTQQGILLQGAERPEVLVYALGKRQNKAKAKELAAINDPVKFAFAVARLEAGLTVSQTPAKPAPERRVSGTSPIGSGLTGNLEALRKKAEETGDYTAYLNAKRKASQSK